MSLTPISYLETFICPITGDIMKDPVIGSDGHTYERSAIEQWLRQEGTSPITRQTMNRTDLTTNIALRDTIESMMRLHPELELEISNIQSSRQSDRQSSAQSSAQSHLNSATVIKPKIIFNIDTDNNVSISIKTLDILERCGADLVFVVDVSGSMGSEATSKSHNGTSQEYGLTILQVVIHALETIVNILGDNDRASLVVFDTNASLVFGLTPMTQLSKKQSIDTIKKLLPKSTTNIWGGLKLGLDVLKQRQDTTRNSAILLFTDGVPNVRPARGEVVMFEKYIRDNNIQVPLHTFGFGYNLDSELLYNLSHSVGSGWYNFIPDSSFVGTIFVNAIGNILSTFGTNMRLNIRPINNAIISNIYGSYSTRKLDDEISLDLGTLQYGQSKDLIIQMDFSKYQESEIQLPYLSCNLSYISNGKRVEIENQQASKWLYQTNSSMANIENLSLEVSEMYFHRMRLNAVTIILTAMETMAKGNHQTSKDMIEQFITVFKTEFSSIRMLSSLQNTKFVHKCSQLLEDLEGQIRIAFSRNDYFSRWGVHYLRSITTAHLSQICNNFKDPGVQEYGGTLFENIRDKSDEIFNRIPPPKPSRTSHSTSYVAPTSMRVYNNSSNPCFAGHCLIRMGDGSEKRVDKLVKDDMIMSFSGPVRLVCILKTICKDGVAELVTLDSGLVITPWHPILSFEKGKWEFPAKIGTPKQIKCPAVYSLVVDKCHIVSINKTPCITLGHNYQDAVIMHPYFGSQEIINDLKAMPGWDSGLITVKSGCLLSKNGLVYKIVYPYESERI